MRQIKIAAFITPAVASLGLLILAFAPKMGAAGPGSQRNVGGRYLAEDR